MECLEITRHTYGGFRHPHPHSCGVPKPQPSHYGGGAALTPSPGAQGPPLPRFPRPGQLLAPLPGSTTGTPGAASAQLPSRASPRTTSPPAPHTDPRHPGGGGAREWGQASAASGPEGGCQATPALGMAPRCPFIAPSAAFFHELSGRGGPSTLPAPPHPVLDTAPAGFTFHFVVCFLFFFFTPFYY